MKKHLLLLLFSCLYFFSTMPHTLASPADEDSLAYTLEKAAGRGDIGEVRKLLGQESRFANDATIMAKSWPLWRRQSLGSTVLCAYS